MRERETEKVPTRIDGWEKIVACGEGRPFVEPDAATEEIAAIAAAIQAALSPAAVAEPVRPACRRDTAALRWKAQARAEGIG